MSSLYSVELHRLAIREANRHYRWYLKRSPTSATAFQAAFDRAIERIQNRPLTCSLDRLLTRNCPLRRFPISLVFVVNSTHCVIYAVAHAKRKPGYWRGRQTRP